MAVFNTEHHWKTLQEIANIAGVDALEKTLQQVLVNEGYSCSSARKNPLLNSIKMSEQLVFVQTPQHWTVENWTDVIWTDEYYI